MCKESESESDSNGWNRAQGLALKALLLLGGALLVKRLRKSTTRWDHTHLVTQSLTGEKVSFHLTFLFFFFFLFLLFLNYSILHPCICMQYSKDQASRDPDNYFNIRFLPFQHSNSTFNLLY